MEIIKSMVDNSSAQFEENKKFHLGLKSELLGKLEKVKQGGGDKYVEKHKSRGKLLARERIEKIIDDGSPFLELSPLAANGVYEEDVPSAGVVTGIGSVHGIQCMFVANDATVKGGTYFPLTVKKHLRAQEVALQTTCLVFTLLTRVVLSCQSKMKYFRTKTTLDEFSSTKHKCLQRVYLKSQ